MDDDITAYLMDKDAAPELGPPPKVFEKRHTIMGTDGIQVVQNAERTVSVVSLTSEMRRLIARTGDEVASTDPTANAAFRVSFDGDHTVTIKAGYINWVKWTGSAWSFQERKVDQTTLNISAVGFPSTIMLKVPMKLNNGNLVSGSPVSLFTSGPHAIDVGNYMFYSEYTTDWTGIDEALFVPPYYEASVSPSTSSTTMFRVRLADITSSGSVEQINFSCITLPQGLSARALSLDIVSV